MALWIKFTDEKPRAGALAWVLNGRTKRPVLRRFQSPLTRPYWYPGGYCRPTDLWCVPEPPAPPAHASLKPRT